MNSKKAHYSWNRYIFEQKELLLIEAKVKDVKSKYSEWNKLGLIDWARSRIENILGPKGVSKYLLYWAREMERQFDIQAESEWGEEPDVDMSDLKEIGEVVLDLIMKFQQNQQRMEEKDIYKYNVSELENVMGKLGLSSREKRSKQKEEAIEGSEIVYDENDIFAVRPYTKNSSCYYGKNTKWCISAEFSRNYFNSYTSDGKAFVMLRMENLEESDRYKKVALVYDRDGSFDEAYDALDYSMGYLEFKDAVAENWAAGQEGLSISKDRGAFNALPEEDQQKVENIADELLDAGRENILDNPPDMGEIYAEEAEQISQRFSFEHAYQDYHIEDQFFFTGGLSVEFDSKLFKNELPKNWIEIHEMSGDIKEMLDTKAQIHGFEEIEINDYGESVILDLRYETYGFEPDPNGYESFLTSLKDIDEQYEKIKNIIYKFFIDRGYVGPSEFHKFIETGIEEFGESLQNLENLSDTDPGEEEIVFISKRNHMVSRYGDLITYIAVRENRLGTSYFNKEIENKIRRSIKLFNTDQLDLPMDDLDPTRYPKLNKENFEIKFSVMLESKSSRIMLDLSDKHYNPILVRLKLKMKNPKADIGEIEDLKRLALAVDQNHLKILKMIQDVIDEKTSKLLKTMKDNLNNLSDLQKKFLNFMKEQDPEILFDRHHSRLGNLANWSLSGKGDVDSYIAGLVGAVEEDGLLPVGTKNPFVELRFTKSDDDDNIFEEVKKYVMSITEKFERKGKCVYKIKTGKKKGCSDSISKAEKYKKALYANSTDIKEDIENYFNTILEDDGSDHKDSTIKSKKYDIIDLMDPDYDIWNVEN